MVGPHRAWWLLVAALVVTVGAVGAVGVWQGASKKPPEVSIDGTAQRSAVQDGAKSGVEKIFTFQATSITAHNTSVLALMTKDYGAKFAQQAPGPDKVGGADSEARVVGTGVVSLSATSASILVFMNRTVTRPNEQPTYDGSRLLVGLSKVGDGWLVDDVAPV